MSALYLQMSCAVPGQASPMAEQDQSGFYSQQALEFRYWNRQIFLKVYLEHGSRKQMFWAVLDSGSTENLFAEIHSTETRNLFLHPDSSPVRMAFHPWGISGFQEYQMILGQPFFRNFCIQMDYGVPVTIHPSGRNPCFPGLLDIAKIPLRESSGQYVVSARAGNLHLDLALDTGSGISSLPARVLRAYGTKTHIHKTILFPSGITKTLPLYEFQTPLFLAAGEMRFILNPVFCKEDVWDGTEGMHPVLGMDFFRQIRIYMDFRSKIVGVDGAKK